MEYTIGLGVLFLLTFFGIGPFPLPVTATLFWLGQYGHPGWTIATALLGTFSGWVTLHRALKPYLLKNTRWQCLIPSGYKRYLLEQAGWAIFLTNAIPLPWEPVRFLALINGYPGGRLLTALMLGRVIRYCLLVFAGALLAPYTGLFWTVLIALLMMPLAMDAFIRRATQSEPNSGEDAARPESRKQA